MFFFFAKISSRSGHRFCGFWCANGMPELLGPETCEALRGFPWWRNTCHVWDCWTTSCAEGVDLKRFFATFSWIFGWGVNFLGSGNRFLDSTFAKRKVHVKTMFFCENFTTLWPAYMKNDQEWSPQSWDSIEEFHFGCAVCHVCPSCQSGIPEVSFLQVDRNMVRLSEKKSKTYQHIFLIFLEI